MDAWPGVGAAGSGDVSFVRLCTFRRTGTRWPGFLARCRRSRFGYVMALCVGAMVFQVQVALGRRHPRVRATGPGAFACLAAWYAAPTLVRIPLHSQCLSALCTPLGFCYRFRRSATSHSTTSCSLASSRWATACDSCRGGEGLRRAGGRAGKGCEATTDHRGGLVWCHLLHIYQRSRTQTLLPRCRTRQRYARSLRRDTVPAAA